MYSIVYVFALCSEIKGLTPAAKWLENIPKIRKSGYQNRKYATAENFQYELKEKEKNITYLTID
jgi:hypothetical protein